MRRRRTQSIDTLSSDSSNESSEGDLDRQLAQKEWEEGLQQIFMIVNLILLPLAGKYLGRRCSQWREHTSATICLRVNSQMQSSLVSVV